MLDYLANTKSLNRISIACTSMGAVSTTNVLTDKNYSGLLTNVVYLDPADYSDVSEKETESSTWTGYDKFENGMGILSNMISKAKGNFKVHIVNFTIRNRTPNGYAPAFKRGIDNPKLKERLNNKMVKAFYDNTPDKNKGNYLEDNTLPHAFFRDGNIKQNVNRIAKLIVELTS